MKGKCYDCKKHRKLYTLSIDPDIQVQPRCKECIENLTFKLHLAELTKQ